MTKRFHDRECFPVTGLCPVPHWDRKAPDPRPLTEKWAWAIAQKTRDTVEYCGMLEELARIFGTRRKGRSGRKIINPIHLLLPSLATSYTKRRGLKPTPLFLRSNARRAFTRHKARRPLGRFQGAVRQTHRTWVLALGFAETRKLAKASTEAVSSNRTAAAAWIRVDKTARLVASRPRLVAIRT